MEKERRGAGRADDPAGGSELERERLRALLAQAARGDARAIEELEHTPQWLAAADWAAQLTEPAVAPCKRTRFEQEVERAERHPVMSPPAALSYARWLGAEARGWRATAPMPTIMPLAMPAPASVRGGLPAMHAASLDERHDEESDWAKLLWRDRASAAGDAQLPSGEGEPLEPELRARMEATFQHDFSHVRIHTDSASGEAAQQMKARAVTRGSHVYFGRGQFAPGSADGDRLLLHELTHVVQADRGQLPSHGGLSSPHDPHEQEAHAAESRMQSALHRADEERAAQRAAPAAPGGSFRTISSPSHLAARRASLAAGSTAPLSRAAAPPAAAPAKTGPGTTEAALLGELPSAAKAAAQKPRPAAAPPRPPPAQAKAPKPTPATSPGGGGRPAPGAPSAAAPPETATRPPAAASPESATRPPAAAPAPPSLANPAEWVAQAREQGAQQRAKVQSTATAAAALLRSSAAQQAARATSSIAAARAQLEADAQAARAQVRTKSEATRAAIEARLTALSTQLDADFTAREQAARTAVQAARARLAQGVEAEAQRAISQSAVRAERARGLAEKEGGGGDAPLAAGQRDIARRVASEVAAQCVQTGADAAAEVRKAGTAQLSGVDSHLDGVLEALGQARTAARNKLSEMRTGARASLDGKAAEALAEIDARASEARTSLGSREQELTRSLTAEAEREAAAVEAKAVELTASVEQSFTSLATSYEQCKADYEAALAESPDAPPELVADVNQQVAAELARLWSEHAAPRLAQVEQTTTTFTSHAQGVADGFAAKVSEAAQTAGEAVSRQAAQLTTVGARFAEACAAAEAQTEGAARSGVAAELAEADRALAAQRAELDAAVAEVLGKLTAAVDGQLAWEDDQIALASTKISAGQAQAVSEYDAAKAEAKRRDQGETASRGWLGDLWNFFDDLAQRTLEWFQEKLGRVWGTIIGGILAAVIYVVGVVVCAAAWLGAQVINLIWGFLWGETAIPGYGGGVVAFIADVIAGVLVYGDVRDVFKYWIWRPLWGEGPWWMNLLMGAVAFLGLIPFFGDGLKAIIKALKGGSKTALKWLAKLIGEELAERIARALGEEVAERIARRLTEELGEELAGKLIREVGAEAAEELLEQLGKEALKALAKDLSAATIKRLLEELGERTLKKLAEELTGEAIEKLSTDLGKEAIEKLLRTVTPSVIKELNEELGEAAVKKLLDGLRGVTLKEYFDALGKDALRNLAKDLDGYAVKELMDALGGPTLKKLADDLGGAAVKQLFDDLGEVVLKKLAGDLGGAAIKQLADDLTPAILKKLGADLEGAVIQRLATDLGAPALKELAEHLAPTMIRDLADTLGKDVLLRLKTAFGADGLKTITDSITPAQLKSFVDEVGEQALGDFGAKALAEVGKHLSPTELLDLLTTPGTTMAFLRSFCEQAGAGAGLRSAAAHFGSIAELGKILAHAEAHAAPVAVLKDFLAQATRLGWKKPAEIGEFFRHAAPSGWADAMKFAEDFYRAGNRAGLKPVVPGSQAGGAAINTVRAGTTDIVTTASDLAHWKAGHTFEEYALTMGNAGRGAESSMWPLATSDAKILSDMNAILADPRIAAEAATAAASGRATTTIGGYFVGLSKVGSDVRLVQFYPDPGTPAIPKAIMRSIVQLFQSL